LKSKTALATLCPFVAAFCVLNVTDPGKDLEDGKLLVEVGFMKVKLLFTIVPPWKASIFTITGLLPIVPYQKARKSNSIEVVPGNANKNFALSI
jgi:hypothetical protein